MTDFEYYHGRNIRGVRTNCSGDQASGESCEEFEKVRVPVSHVAFSQANLCRLPIASRLSIPIIPANYPRREDGVRCGDWNSAYRDLQQSWLLES